MGYNVGMKAPSSNGMSGWGNPPSQGAANSITKNTNINKTNISNKTNQLNNVGNKTINTSLNNVGNTNLRNVGNKYTNNISDTTNNTYNNYTTNNTIEKNIYNGGNTYQIGGGWHHEDHCQPQFTAYSQPFCQQSWGTPSYACNTQWGGGNWAGFGGFGGGFPCGGFSLGSGLSNIFGGGLPSCSNPSSSGCEGGGYDQNVESALEGSGDNLLAELAQLLPGLSGAIDQEGDQSQALCNPDSIDNPQELEQLLPLALQLTEQMQGQEG